MKGNAKVRFEAVHSVVLGEVRDRRLGTPTKIKPFCSAAERATKLVFRWGLLFVLATSFMAAACGLIDQHDGRAIVTVGKWSLGPDELKRDIKRLIPDLEISPEEWVRFRRDLVERIVDHYLILEYGREKGIVVSDEELEAAVKDVQRDYAQADFREVLLKRCIDLDEWKEGLREQILIRKIMQSVIETVPAATTEEIRTYFEVHAHEFKQTPMIKVRQVVTRTSKEAQELARALARGGNMEELARKQSITPDGPKGGEIGWIGLGEMEENVEKVLFSLSVGQISPVVESASGFHVFQVVSQRIGGSLYHPEVASEIERRVFSQKGEAFFSDWLQGLRDRFPAAVNQKLLERLEWAS